jgi:hypothetical protein
MIYANDVHCSIFCQMKACAYIVMGLIEDDEESQRRGVVLVAYYVCRLDNAVSEIDWELHRNMNTFADWIPFRIVGMHLCTDPHFLDGFKSVFVAAIGRALRIRLRIHNGTPSRKQVVLKENRRLTFRFLL